MYLTYVFKYHSSYIASYGCTSSFTVMDSLGAYYNYKQRYCHKLILKDFEMGKNVFKNITGVLSNAPLRMILYGKPSFLIFELYYNCELYENLQ